MTLSALLVLSILGASSADDLVTAKFPSMSLRVPGAWTHNEQEGSHNYKSPADDGEFQLSIFSIPARDPHLCLDQLLKALGDKKWERLSVGTHPAARSIALDSTKDKGSEGKVETRTYLGCNGKTKWVLSFSMKTEKKDRYAALAEKIVDSVQYVKEDGK